MSGTWLKVYRKEVKGTTLRVKVAGGWWAFLLLTILGCGLECWSGVKCESCESPPQKTKESKTAIPLDFHFEIDSKQCRGEFSSTSAARIMINSTDTNLRGDTFKAS